MDSKTIKFDNKKLKEAILFLLYQYPNKTIEGKKKLAKLLYFADFNNFELYETPLTGATYRALPMGPVPDELDKTLQELEGKLINITKKNIGLTNDVVVFSLNTDRNNLNFDNLTNTDKKILEKVYNDYGRLSGGVLESITHAEAPFNAVAQGEHIPYELAFYRGKTKEELIGV